MNNTLAEGEKKAMQLGSTLRKALKGSIIALCIVIAIASAAVPGSNHCFKDGKWMTGDFCNPTFLTDDSRTQIEVLKCSFGQYCTFSRNPEGIARPNDTIFMCDPLSDELPGINDAAKAHTYLWVHPNTIFVSIH
jgi:hypothetical protein